MRCDESRRVSRVDGVLVSRVWSRVSVGMFYRCVSVVVSEWYSMRDCTVVSVVVSGWYSMRDCTVLVPRKVARVYRKPCDRTGCETSNVEKPEVLWKRDGAPWC